MKYAAWGPIGPQVKNDDRRTAYKRWFDRNVTPPKADSRENSLARDRGATPHQTPTGSTGTRVLAMMGWEDHPSDGQNLTLLL